MIKHVILHAKKIRGQYLLKQIPELIELESKEPLMLWQHWISFENVNGLKKYSELIRCLADLYQVSIFRNERTIYEGIYIVGGGYLVERVTKIIKLIIGKIEHETRYAPRIEGLHYSKAKSLHVSNCINHYLEILRSLRRIKDKRLNKWFWDKERMRRVQFKQEYTNLKTKKEYHAKR